MAEVLSAEDISQLEVKEVESPTPISRKAALDTADISYLDSVEKVIKGDPFGAQEPTAEEQAIKTYGELGSLTPDSIQTDLPKVNQFDFEKKLHDLMAKGSRSFTENIGESFKNADESSAIQVAAYDTMLRPGSYESEIKPLWIEYQKRVSEDPVQGKNFVSNAVYAVAGTIPAMGKGMIEGYKTSAQYAAAGLVLAPGATKIPAAIAMAGAGKLVGSVSYWYKQGAGSLYIDLKEQGIEDTIAIPTAHIAGSIYAGIEFSQVDKLIPGSKEVVKRAIVQSTKKAIAKLVVKYGVTWVQEVTEEGLQEIVMSIAKDAAMNIAGVSDKSMGDIWQTAASEGAHAMKEAAPTMGILLGPKAIIDTATTVRATRAVEQARNILRTPVEGGGIRFSLSGLKSYLQFEGKRVEVKNLADAQAKWREVVMESMKQGARQRELGEDPQIVSETGKEIGRLSWNGSFYQVKPEANKELDIRFSRTKQSPEFYSQLERTLEEKMPNSASPAQIMGIVSSGVKKEQLEWIDLESFLKGKDKVTKQEVLDYVRAHDPSLTTVERGSKKNAIVYKKLKGVDEDEGTEVTYVAEIGDAGEVTIAKYDDGFYATMDDDQLGPFDTLEQAKAAVDKETDGYGELMSDVKHSQHMKPWTINPTYREWTMALDSKEHQDQKAYNKTLNDEGAVATQRFRNNEITLEQLERIQEDIKSRRNYKNTVFSSTHYPEPNIIVNFMGQDETIGGKRYLHIMEVQSDWHQKGRHDGYRTKADGLPSDMKVVKDGEVYKVVTAYDGTIITSASTEQKAIAQALEYLSTTDGGKVPDAPFKNSWQELALKRILRIAVEEGYDGILTDTGEIVAGRYDLSKQVAELNYRKEPNGSYLIGIKDINDKVHPSMSVEEKKLAETVGKEVADKIIQGEGVATVNGLKVLSGLDLKVGGKFHKTLYDQKIPNFLNAYTKKWGGRVEDMTIKSNPMLPKEHKEFGYEDRLPSVGTPAHGLTITPAMRESVMAGQPLFSRQGKGGDQTAEEIRDRVVRLTSGMANRPDFIVVQSTKDAEQYAGKEVPFNAEAFFVNLNGQDTIVFIADTLSQARMDFVLYHELVGHYGMKSIFGPRMAYTMQSLYDNSPEIRAAADEVMTTFPEYSFTRAVEEALADKAGEVVKAQTEPAWWAKPRKIVRDAMRAYLGKDLAIDDHDLAVMIQDAKKTVEGQDAEVDSESIPLGVDQEEAVQADMGEELRVEINNLLADEVQDDTVEEMNEVEQERLGTISETTDFLQDMERLTELEQMIQMHDTRLEIMKSLPKIKRYKGADLAEEIADIPEVFLTEDPSAANLDEAGPGLAENMDDKSLGELSESEIVRYYKNALVTPAERKQRAAWKKELDQTIKEMKRKNPVIKAAVEKIQKRNIGPIRVNETTIIKRLFKERFKGERMGIQIGKEQATQQIMSSKEILDRRRNRIRGLQDQFGLSDADLRKINRKDIRLMTNYEFKLFIDKMEAMAVAYAERRQIKNQILFQITSKELQKTENLMEILKIKSLDTASVAQLNELNQILEDMQKGDVFLSVRKLETVKNTELAGIKTLREAKEILAKKLGVPLEQVNNIEVATLDKFLYDTALARQNPFYQMLVDETNMSLLDGEQRFLEMEREVDDLTNKARKSRKRSMFDQFAPTDALVFQWLEAKPEQKAELAQQMTPEELALAGYLQARFAQFRDYLIEHQVLKHFQSDYITHIRRGFLETWKEDGFLNAFKEVFAQYQEDEATFKILEGDTQNILPLEKFFQFSMRRSGELTPSKNVAKAFKAYTKAFTKKQSLDKIIPALDIYAHALSPKGLTPKGLQMNRQLIQFVKEWINNKKGRKNSLGGLIPQGGKIDLGLRAIDGFITMIDLGLNIPVGLTVQIGEQITTYVNIGTKQYARGVARMNTAKGKAIIKANEALIGKSPFAELSNAADGLGDKFYKGIFSLFEIASRNANKIHVLGAMTDAEYAAGKFTPARAAEIRREIGRFRAVKGAKSIFGSTSGVAVLTKYKSWGLPILNTVIDDLAKLTVMAKNQDFNGAMKSKEFQELFRATMTTSFFTLVAIAVAHDDDDKSFLGELTRKALRESMSIMGAIDPTYLSAVRLASFMADLSLAIKQIVTLEKYKTQKGYKGVSTLRRTVVPKALKPLFKDKKKGKNIYRSIYSSVY
jgi:hypothetical protein